MTDPNNKMFYIGFCRICGTGPLGLRTCGGCGRIVVLCDECDAVWTDADVAAEPAFSNDPALPCPSCSQSLFDSPSHWATRDEINGSEWLADAIAKGSISLEEGVPLAPPSDDSAHDEAID